MVEEDPDSGFVELGQPGPEEELQVEEPLDLRPRSAPEQLDLAIEVLRARPLALIGVCVLLWLPFRAAMPWLVELTDVRNLDGGGGEDEVLPLFMALAGMAGAQTIVTLLSTAVVTVLVYDHLVGHLTSPGSAVLAAMRRLPGLVVVLIGQGLAIGISLPLLSLLGIFCPPFLLVAVAVYLWLTWKLWLAPSALVLEELGPVAAIKRSWSLTYRTPWRWLGVFVLASILGSFFAGVASLGDNAELRDELLAASGIPLPLFNALFIGVSAVFFGFATAIQAGTITSHYLDTRIRREGFDLEMRLERLRGLHPERGE